MGYDNKINGGQNTMSIKLLIHGVPKGYTIWGNDDDGYCRKFYSTNRDEYKKAQFVLHQEIINSCSYYTYLCLNNVSQNGGRGGSYFGMTLKMPKQYIKDVYVLNDLFEQIFDRYILINVIKKNGNSYTYSVDGFNEVDVQLKKTSDAFSEQINNGFKNDIETIDPSFERQKVGDYAYFNIEDVNSPYYFNETKKYRYVLISKEYSTSISKISIINTKYNEMKKKYEQVGNDCQKYKTQADGIPSLETEISNLRKQTQSKDSEIAKLKREKDSLHEEKKKLENEIISDKELTNYFKTMEELVSQSKRIQELINKKQGGRQKSCTNTVSEPRSSSQGENKNQKKRSKKKNITLIVIATLILSSVAALLYININPKEKSREENITLNANYNNRKEVINTNAINQNHSSYPNAKILFDNQDIETFLEAKVYTVNISGINEQKGSWKIDGFDVIKGKLKEGKGITVKPTRDTAIISYYINDDKLITKRYYVNELKK